MKRQPPSSVYSVKSIISIGCSIDRSFRLVARDHISGCFGRV